MKIEFIYQWKAVNKKGSIITGENIAQNRKFIFNHLSQLDLQPYAIKRRQIIFYSEKEIAYRLHFTQQLNTLLTSGIPLLQALNILLPECKSIIWRCILSDVIQKISQGESFSTALQNYPELFSPLFCQFIAVGEQTGQLEACCQLLIKQLEQKNILHKKFQKSYRYPLIISFVAIVVLLLMLIFVLPEFKQVYSSFDASLPLLTLWVLSASDFLLNYGFFVSTTILATIVSYLGLRSRFPILYEKEKIFFTQLPLFKKIITYSHTSQIFHILFMTQKSGLTLTIGLECALNATHHPLFMAGIKSLNRQIQQGVSMSNALKKESCFPPLCKQFVIIGEESGELELFLGNLAIWYQEQFINCVDNLVHLLEPVLMLLMAVIVGLLLLAMYLPIFQLGTILT
ncbi:protein transport protein HofC [Xenorhabdus innexi]|uniref:Component in type IV pilin biogenesis, transmembrane protein n=1 Tax=Xenorhabdus innexi TaxID=290109 RepID=A0A1N6MUW5_9GAMM|nr:protein transport protein HofC [Xenorhabdus innexi]PHM31131.1 type IV pilus biogenesis protein PilC [Xenorhabdus innexi]SIP72611.1 Component in type IV pilin biogenesis, transmembrane protein [Xenorhabdus innexi]